MLGIALALGVEENAQQPSLTLVRIMNGLVNTERSNLNERSAYLLYCTVAASAKQNEIAAIVNALS
jgi:hypothetical protein